MVKFNQIFKYTKTAINQFKNAENVISKNTDLINTGIGTTNDIVSNVQIGRELVQFTKNTQPITYNFAEEYTNNVQNILENHLDKIDITQNLTDKEKKEFIKNIQGDESTFVTFAMNEKPCILIYGKNKFIKANDKYDVVRRKIIVPVKNKKINIHNTIILNKELTKKTIEDNKEIYIKRLGLDNNADTETIYNELIGENSPLKGNKKHDIIGITLGYSPVNSIIYQLDQNIPNNIEQRDGLNTYKKNLLNQLFKEDSIYKDFDNNFKQKIATLIRNIGNDKQTFDTKWNKFGFTYINIVPDENHDKKLMEHIIESYKKTQSILQEDT